MMKRAGICFIVLMSLFMLNFAQAGVVKKVSGKKLLITGDTDEFDLDQLIKIEDSSGNVTATAIVYKIKNNKFLAKIKSGIAMAGATVSSSKNSTSTSSPLNDIILNAGVYMNKNEHMEDTFYSAGLSYRRKFVNNDYIRLRLGLQYWGVAETDDQPRGTYLELNLAPEFLFSTGAIYMSLGSSFGYGTLIIHGRSSSEPSESINFLVLTPFVTAGVHITESFFIGVEARYQYFATALTGEFIDEDATVFNGPLILANLGFSF